MFLTFQVVHLGCGMSDHKPIQILTLGITPRRNRPWQFEQTWLSEVGCHEIVKAAWGAELMSPTMNQVGKKIKLCQRDLKWWSSRFFKNISWTLNEKKYLLSLPKKLHRREVHLTMYYTLRRRFRCCLHRRKNCGSKGPMHIGCPQETKIQIFSTIKLPNTFEEIKLRALETMMGIYA